MIGVAPVAHDFEVGGLDCVDFSFFGDLVQILLFGCFVMSSPFCFGRLSFISVSLTVKDYALFDRFMDNFLDAFDILVVFLIVEAEKLEIN